MQQNKYIKQNIINWNKKANIRKLSCYSPNEIVQITQFLPAKDDYNPKYAIRLKENVSIKSGTDKKSSKIETTK